MKRVQDRIDSLAFQLYHRETAGKLEAVARYLEDSKAPVTLPKEVEMIAGGARETISQFNAFGSSLSGNLMANRVERVLTTRHYRYQSRVDSDARFLSNAADRLLDPEIKLWLWDRFLIGLGFGYRKQRAI